MLTSKHVGLKSRTVCYAATHQQQSKPRSIARSIVRSIAPSIARSIAPSIARSIARSLVQAPKTKAKLGHPTELSIHCVPACLTAPTQAFFKSFSVSEQVIQSFNLIKQEVRFYRFSSTIHLVRGLRLTTNAEGAHFRPRNV